MASALLRDIEENTREDIVASPNAIQPQMLMRNEALLEMDTEQNTTCYIHGMSLISDADDMN